MVTSVEVLKAVVREHDLRYLVVTAMDGSKIHQANGIGPEECCKALDEAAALMGSDPFRVRSWFDKVEAGGKLPRLAKDFQWVVKLSTPGVPVAMPGTDSRLLEAIQGIASKLTAVEDRMSEMEDEDEDEPAAAPEPVWLGTLMLRVVPLLDKVLGLPPQPAAINGPSGAADDDAFIRAAKRAKADPVNAAFVDQLMAAYGDKPATDESAKA